jgi:hypothetical protein
LTYPAAQAFNYKKPMRRSHASSGSNIPVERDRQQAALVGSLRGFAAPAAPHLQR